MKIRNFLLLCAVLIHANLLFSQINGSEFCIGTRTKLYSQALGEERDILIHLPENYSSTKDEYPVLFVLDGEWNFPHAISYVTYLSDTDIAPDMIVIAICNTNRLRDFLPTHVFQVPASGGSDNFITFLKDEVIPFVDKKYRSSGNRILYGESNSGLFGIYSLLRNPNLFESYIISSPTVAHDNYHINRLAEEVFRNPEFPEKRLILTYGSEEGQWMISQILEFIKMLKKHAPTGLRCEIVELPNERHASPIALYEGLRRIHQTE